MAEKRTFFISRAGADRHWAELIAGVVRDAGHAPIHQDEDFQYGVSFIHSMRAASWWGAPSSGVTVEGQTIMKIPKG
jgi:hypothetical protein